MKIYLWSIKDHGYEKVFENEQELIEFLGTHYSRFFGEWNAVNFTWNDTRRYEDFSGHAWYETRNDIFVHEDWTVVDIRHYERQAKKISERHVKSRKDDRTPDHEYGELLCKWYWRGDKGLYKFRCGPVPGTGHSHHGYWLRHPHTTREKRQNADPEVIPYVRPARRPHILPSVYDDIPRSNERCWKSQKKRHQWE